MHEKPAPTSDIGMTVYVRGRDDTGTTRQRVGTIGLRDFAIRDIMRSQERMRTVTGIGG
ncbi:hypothetical protein [Streptomyces sp. NPDC005732]|uniref:hypothetical protein n=1 Tax=Streptomyces sp. NPDC005732 TaxID=3157057 RepID=UPI0033C0C323